MTNDELTNFQASIVNMSVEDLKSLKAKYDVQIAQMIFENDTVMKAALINSLINEKEGK